MKQFEIKNRPPYFISSSYHPEGEEAQSNWNVYSYPIPDKRSWLYDQIEYYATKECRVEDAKKELLDTLSIARRYDESCLSLLSTDTIVTHLYVCELLVKALLLFFEGKTSTYHGYSARHLINSTLSSISEYFLESKNGITQDLHNLFYSTPLPMATSLPSLKEYLRFCPELSKECSEILHIPPYVFKAIESYGATGSHSGNGHFHFCSPDLGVSTLKGFRDLHTKRDSFYPELTTNYTIGNQQTGYYTEASAESEQKSDKFISVTADLNGTRYALGFGESAVHKQRDIEIRFYIIYLLGSIARYSPSKWKELKNDDPGLSLMIKRFIDNNHLIFPFIVLRYMTGRAYSLTQTAVFG